MAQKGLWDEAMGIFETEAATHPTPANYYNLGICYEALGLYNKAEQQYKNAISAKPKGLYVEALANIKKLREEKEILREREQ
jgi:tetratricopeptide (TPR) repeat protein